MHMLHRVPRELGRALLFLVLLVPAGPALAQEDILQRTYAAVEQRTPLRSSAAISVVVFQCPRGILASNRRPTGARPRGRVMLALAQVSSMKIRRDACCLG